MSTAVLVAGLGNEYRSDDGAGPAVAAYVSERMPKVVSKVISEPLDLIGAWDDAGLAVVVDATRSGSPPGTVQLVDLGTGEDVGSSAGPMSSHGMDLPRVLRLARAMGHPPRRVVVVGIEGENFADGVGLSPAVELAVTEAGDLVLQVIEEASSMCMSRLHRAVTAPADGWMTVENAEGRLHRVSLIALEGPEPQVGDWLVVHSGYALRRVDIRRGCGDSERAQVRTRSSVLITVSAGPLFARYAYPPNALGYCGPPDPKALVEAGSPDARAEDLASVARCFSGAWPYLELIASANAIADPLDARVVEAYWVGSELLEGIPATSLLEAIGRHPESGPDGGAKLREAVTAGGVAHHSFHVFAVYPWLALLRSGKREPALTVLERCRIRWGRIEAVEGENVDRP